MIKQMKNWKFEDYIIAALFIIPTLAIFFGVVYDIFN